MVGSSRVASGLVVAGLRYPYSVEWTHRVCWGHGPAIEVCHAISRPMDLFLSFFPLYPRVRSDWRA